MSKSSSVKLTPKSNKGNTLFNYFAKSPASAQKPKEETTGNSAQKALPAKKEPERASLVAASKRSVEEESDEEPLAVKSKRRRTLILEDSSDSEAENKQPNESLSESVNVLSTFEFGNTSVIAEEDADDEPTPKKAKKTAAKKHVEEDETRWEHERVPFLRPEEIRDAKKRRPNHPDYDPRTLYVPESYLNSITPAMRQWWELKSQHFDTVLFFKVGKFYELYHMDAAIGVQELKFTYMRGSFAHSGFPEQAYDKMATQLVELGYRVARVEQTENPDMIAERLKRTSRPTKFDKVSRREICQVTELGTQVFTQQTALTEKPEARLLMALCESPDSPTTSKYGVCFVDTSICDFFFGEFADDKHSSRLLTLLAHYNPVLVLFERGGVSERTQNVFKTMLRTCKKEALAKNIQMLSAEKTLKELKEKYFNANEGKAFPSSLKTLQAPDDSLGLTPAANASLILKSLGGIIWYLQKSFLDQQVLDTARFSGYVPPDQALETVSNANRFMVLDAITLSNLRVIGEDFSLLRTIDNCCTKFGKRLLHSWLCSPSGNLGVIKARQNAVQELYSNTEMRQKIRLILARLPDLERLLAVLHGFGNPKPNHPDTRAILYEMPTYNKKKISDFTATLNGFEALLALPDATDAAESRLLKKLTQQSPEGEFPDMKDILLYFKETFDFTTALKTGNLEPKSGTDDDEDISKVDRAIKDLEEELEEYRKKQEKHFGCKVSYFGSDKKRFQIEVPESSAKKAGDKYHLESQKKGKQPAKRYYTAETKDFLKQMQNLEAERKAIMSDFSRRVFAKFSKHFDLWKTCVGLVAELDVLSGLAEYAHNQGTICVPELVESDSPVLELTESFHPCLAENGDFIPNDVSMGVTKAPLALLTGPNMGGKSTLMRQVGLLAVMVQVGAMIPAASCRISLVDRIFTRLGAQDDIISGQSTFLVELCETSAILKHATTRSLVLLDELGRGTSTYDGNAIAGAVVSHLAEKRCRCLFSTHYHNLVDNFKDDDRVVLGHMACMVENEDSEDPTQETVTFLYKYVDGPCPKSYGFNAAKLAGMPNAIIRRAFELSKRVEAIAYKRKLLSKIMNKADKEVIQDCLSKLRACTI